MRVFVGLFKVEDDTTLQKHAWYRALRVLAYFAIFLVVIIFLLALYISATTDYTQMGGVTQNAVYVVGSVAALFGSLALVHIALSCLLYIFSGRKNSEVIKYILICLIGFSVTIMAVSHTFPEKQSSSNSSSYTNDPTSFIADSPTPTIIPTAIPHTQWSEADKNAFTADCKAADWNDAYCSCLSRKFQQEYSPDEYTQMKTYKHNTGAVDPRMLSVSQSCYLSGTGSQ